MRFVENGRVVREMAFTCGKCRNTVPDGLVVVAGGLPLPKDIPIICPHCHVFVAMANASDSPPPPDEADQLAKDAAAIEQIPDQGEKPNGEPLRGA